MNPINRWLLRRQMGRALADQFEWTKGSLQALAAVDPERAIKAKFGLRAILQNSFDPADPMANPRAITEFLMKELEAAMREEQA